MFHAMTYTRLLGKYALSLHTKSKIELKPPTITWNIYCPLADISRPSQDQQQGAYFIILTPSGDVGRVINH